MTGWLGEAGHAWAHWMVPMAWQAAWLIVVVAAVDRLWCRWAWPQLRHALWLLVAVKLLLPPAFASPWSLAARVVPEPPLGTLPAAPPAPAGLSAATWLALAWAAGVVLLGAGILLRTRRERRCILAAAAPAPGTIADALEEAAARLRIAELPRIVVSPAAHSPAVFGLARPVIVLPPDVVAEMTREELVHVLLHELAHIQRRDLWAQAIFGAVHLVYWFHPLVWIARRRAYAVRELCCDATVAGALRESTPAYRRTLLRAARPLVEAPRTAGAAGLLFGPSTMLARLHALQKESWRHPVRRRVVTAIVSLAVFATVVPMAEAGTRSLSTARIARLLTLRKELDETRRLFQQLVEDPATRGCASVKAAAVRALFLEQQIASLSR